MDSTFAANDMLLWIGVELVAVSEKSKGFIPAHWAL